MNRKLNLTIHSPEAEIVEALERLPCGRRRVGRISWRTVHWHDDYFCGNSTTRVFVSTGFLRRIEITRNMPNICKAKLIEYIDICYRQHEAELCRRHKEIENAMQYGM